MGCPYLGSMHRIECRYRRVPELLPLRGGMLSIGETAPTFQLTAQDKSKFDSREHEGSRLVVVFYPAAFTGVCTEEMCTFTDLTADLENSGCVVVGISVDAPFSNAAFAKQNNIPFPLLSDVHRSVINSFGIPYNDFVIEGYTVATRSVFVIDPDGKISYAWAAENPGVQPNYESVISHCLNN